MLVASILVNIVSGLIITNYEHVFFIEIYNCLPTDSVSLPVSIKRYFQTSNKQER